MGVPATTGRLCKTLAEMEIGDYIRCTYTADTANAAGEFSDLGGFVDKYTTIETITDENGNQTQAEVEKTYGELPFIPIDKPIGYFYLLKVNKGLAVADRMIQTKINTDSLDSANYVYGKIANSALFRLLSFDEYVQYLGNSDLGGNITPKDNNVWNGRKNIPDYFGSAFSTSMSSGNLSFSMYREITQTRTASTTKTIFDLAGESYNSAYHLYIYNYSNGAYGWKYSVYVPLSVDYNETFADCSHYYSDHWRDPYNVVCLVDNSFRPAIEYIDNPKSQTIWY